jgi:hypothetical protein
MGGACSEYGKRRGVYGVLLGKPEGKRPLGRPRPRWEDNIKMDFEEVGYRRVDWIELGQVAGTCECGNETSGSIKCGEILDQLQNQLASQEGFLVDGVSM